LFGSVLAAEVGRPYSSVSISVRSVHFGSGDILVFWRGRKAEMDEQRRNHVVPVWWFGGRIIISGSFFLRK